MAAISQNLWGPTSNPPSQVRPTPAAAVPNYEHKAIGRLRTYSPLLAQSLALFNGMLKKSIAADTAIVQLFQRVPSLQYRWKR